jgi:hypothetical protein
MTWEDWGNPFPPDQDSDVKFSTLAPYYWALVETLRPYLGDPLVARAWEGAKMQFDKLPLPPLTSEDWTLRWRTMVVMVWNAVVTATKPPPPRRRPPPKPYRTNLVLPS